MRLEGKAALITGSARGIGKAIALKFLQEGASVALVDVLEDRLEETRRELSSLGEVHAVVANLSSAEDCQRAVAEADAALAGMNVLVNNAAIVRVKEFLDLTVDDWDLTMAVNARAPFLLGQQAARRMIEGGRPGVIINAASTNGFAAERLCSSYDASKGAVVLLTQAMALDLAGHGIRVAGVAPGQAGPTELATDGGVTELDLDATNARVPLGRIATVQEVANVYAFVASDEASHVAGTTVVVDGGLLSRQYGDPG